MSHALWWCFFRFQLVIRPPLTGGCVIWEIRSDKLHNRWASRLLSWQGPCKLFFITHAFTFIALFLWAYSVGMMKRWKTLDPFLKTCFSLDICKFQNIVSAGSKVSYVQEKIGWNSELDRSSSEPWREVVGVNKNWWLYFNFWFWTRQKLDVDSYTESYNHTFQMTPDGVKEHSLMQSLPQLCF